MINGIGIDIIEIARIKKAIDRWGEDFLHHVFTEEEIAYAKQHKNPMQHYAARFAAKEAIYKAVSGIGHTLHWKDINIKNDTSGRPHALIKARDFNQDVFISMSHSDHYAVANAIISSE